jgi:outer membrane immunogenic protein
MKNVAIGSIALLAVGLAGPAAFAADMRARPLPAPVVVANWTGCYVGLNIGESWGRSKHEAVAGTTAIRGTAPVTLAAGTSIADSFNLSGMIGGAHLGCNYQVGAWVFGIEGDYSVTNKEGQAFEIQNSPNWYAATKERWLSTVRGRIGYTVTDKWLWYVTGGGAWAKFDITSTLVSNPLNTFTQSNTRGGWTVGLGTEYMLGYGWSIRSEFLYVDFGTFTTFTNTGISPNVFAPRDVKVNDYIFRFGMTYQFGAVGKGKGVAPIAVTK